MPNNVLVELDFVPVEERRPRKGDTSAKIVRTITNGIGIAVYKDNSWIHVSTSGLMGAVTHWTELPDLLKEMRK
jgi:hypothetical protein